MQLCTSLQADNHASTPPLSFFTGWMPFLPPNQQRQSTKGTSLDFIKAKDYGMAIKLNQLPCYIQKITTLFLILTKSVAQLNPNFCDLNCSACTTWVSRYQKGKTSLHLNEARNDWVLG